MFLFGLETNVFNVILVLLKHIRGERTKKARHAKKNYNGLVATGASIADISQEQAIKTKNRQNDSRNFVCFFKIIHEIAISFESNLPLDEKYRRMKHENAF